MVRKYFIGCPSFRISVLCEKTKTAPGLALRRSLRRSYQEATAAAVFFPAAGNGNGQSWNNRGSNGNYWSSSLNSAANGRNLNFNSSGVNSQNNNNRFNGFPVRAVHQSRRSSFSHCHVCCCATAALNTPAL